MAPPSLPNEIISAIIRQGVPPWKGGRGDTHQDRCGTVKDYYELSKVNDTWKALLKAESMRLTSIDVPIGVPSDENYNSRIQLAMMKELVPGRDIQYAALVQKIRIKLWCPESIEGEDPIVPTVEEIFQICLNLNEVATFGLELQTLVALSRLKHVHSLHLQQSTLPLVAFGQPLSFLRHLSLENHKGIESAPDYKDMFEFLSPSYLPSLDSLNITQIFLSSPTFLNLFLKIAPQLQYLFLAPSDQRHANSLFTQYFTVDIILPTTLLSACISLKHLALYHASYTVTASIPFNSFAAHLPSSLQTLVLEFEEFRCLRQEYPFLLPRNLQNLRNIIIHPAHRFYECFEDLSCVDWAKQFGVHWRLATEYSEDWIEDELDYDRIRYESIQREVEAMEVWNDLKDRLE